ncbi:hypothetical protein FACS189485_01780 [Spirochaetia bacterium]|nr:hypothetical protein FACS189485_01780 [Spirochaetia bacterium]
MMNFYQPIQRMNRHFEAGFDKSNGGSMGMSRKITGKIPNRIAEDGTPILTVEAYTFHPAEKNHGAGYDV